MTLFQTVSSGYVEKFAAVSHILLQQLRKIRLIVPKGQRFRRFCHGNTRMGERSAITSAEFLRGDYTRAPQVVQKEAVLIPVHMRDIILLRQSADHVLCQCHRGPVHSRVPISAVIANFSCSILHICYDRPF